MKLLYSAYRGLGLGKPLLDQAIKKATELKYIEMVLESNRILEKAQLLYLQHGFKKYGTKLVSERCNYAMRKELVSNSYKIN